jgi:hypothetical protein
MHAMVAVRNSTDRNGPILQHMADEWNRVLKVTEWGLDGLA